MSLWQALWLALLQGATEILPVSSLGHGVILHSLLGRHVNQESPTFVPFFVVLHLGTATALLVFFRREWASVIRGFFRTLATRNLKKTRRHGSPGYLWPALFPQGSWEAGKNGAEPGIIMPANPKVGQTYRQEYLKGVAEDMARPVKLNGSTTVPYGTFHNVLVTDEWSPLEPNVAEQKYYAPGVGNVLERATKGPKERLELIDIKHG